jgi:hypothetical protein
VKTINLSKKNYKFKDNTYLGNKGIKIFVNVKLPNVRNINLCKNFCYSENCGIGNEGIKLFNKCKFPSIDSLKLCKL